MRQIQCVIFSLSNRGAGAPRAFLPRTRSTRFDAHFDHLLAFYASSHADYYLDQVAISHSRAHLDIRPGLYDLWLEALIDTVRSFDEQFDDDVELAWRLVMTPGIVYMRFHYDRCDESNPPFTD